jgi:hypothetical protein
MGDTVVLAKKCTGLSQSIRQIWRAWMGVESRVESLILEHYHEDMANGRDRGGAPLRRRGSGGDKRRHSNRSKNQSWSEAH